MSIKVTCLAANVLNTVGLPDGAMLTAEIVTEGVTYGALIPTWYVDAAQLKAGGLVRDLTDVEIDVMEQNDTFIGYACEAIHEYESNYDPTP